MIGRNAGTAGRLEATMNAALWVVAIAMIVVGVAGTVLPALPGLVLVFGGIVLAAWIDDFARISPWTVGGLAVLMLLGVAADYVAAALGAKKAGASRLAVVGAAIGTVAGIFTGFVGLVFMPLVGAALGELIAQKDVWRAGKVGIATWLGLLVGTALKVAIVFTMVGVFVIALMV
jgi:uncharacterized protein YqgC (DUF456 family)